MLAPEGGERDQIRCHSASLHPSLVPPFSGILRLVAEKVHPLNAKPSSEKNFELG